MTIIARAPRWGALILVLVLFYVAVQFAARWRRPHAAAAARTDELTPADTAAGNPTAVDRLVARALAQIPPSPASTDPECDSTTTTGVDASVSPHSPLPDDPHRSR